MTPSHFLRSRRPRGTARLPRATTDPEAIAAHLEDAAHYPGGHATALYTPGSEAEVAAILQASPHVLAIGAQSSLTGGATPAGGVLISTARLDRIDQTGTGSVRVGAGVAIATLDAALAVSGRYYPPTPTFTGAFVGGTVSTNAAGAATFRHGTTRAWVQALTVVLAAGDTLEIERGRTHAHPDGYFDLELSSGCVRVPAPTYVMPEVAKLSAGYFAAPGMDLIDLFIGSEGTLGVITDVTLRVIETRPAFCLALVTFPAVTQGLSFVRQARRMRFVSAIEHMDGASLQLLREDRVDVANGAELPDDAAIGLLVTLELPAGCTAAEAFEQIALASGDRGSAEAPLTEFCRALASMEALDRTHIAAPGDAARARQLLNLREGVPAGVNQRVARLKAAQGAGIEKVAADVIVPVDRLDELLAFCAAAFDARQLHGAVWGHVSDGNLHPNVVPRSASEIAAGKDAILAIGREAIRLGGAPLAEHGVGRNAVKQQLLREMYGAAGIEQMRRVKGALDPEWKLAPGVLFSR